MCQVEGHPVIADVSPYFGTERSPEGRETLLILPGARPLLDPLELRPEPFPAGFHLGNRRPFARPPPVEEEAQKLEGALRLPSPGCLFGEGEAPRLEGALRLTTRGCLFGDGDQPRFLRVEPQTISGKALPQRTQNTL